MLTLLQVAPQKKLPALYVLDSVVKNVGTPYTLYFSRKLMSTFMDAYASVDQATRRKMDEMLRTWKEPIPGSIDTRPPFPPDVVRPIETALIKARTKAFEGQQENFHAQQQLLGRGRSAVPYRNTPTPPGVRPASYQHGPYGQQPFPGPNGYPANGQPTAYPIHPGAVRSQNPMPSYGQSRFANSHCRPTHNNQPT
jgi:pre-mRNA cleavage complex 2 protein Pcf11